MTFNPANAVPVEDEPQRPRFDPRRAQPVEFPDPPPDPWNNPRNPMSSPLYGAGEVAASMLTGTLGALVGGANNIGQALFTDKNSSEIAQSGNRVAEALAYQPRNKYGKATTKVVAYPFEKFAQFGNFAQDWIGYDSPSQQRLGVAANLTPQLALQLALTLLGVRAGVRTAGAAAEVAGKSRLPSMIDRFTPGGAGRIAGRVQREIAGTPEMRAMLVEALRKDNILVKGSKPTAAESVNGMPEGSPIQASQEYISAQTGARAGAPSTLFGRHLVEQNAAREAAKAEREAITGKMRDDALDAAGMVDAKPVLKGIRDMVAEVGQRTNEVRQGVLTDAYKKIVKFSDDSGKIDARDLYGVRMNIGLKINDLLEKGAGWDRKQASLTDRKVQLMIDDVIESSGGTGWKDYLNEYSTRSKAIKADELRTETMYSPTQRSIISGQETPHGATAPGIDNMLQHEVMLVNALLRHAGKGAAPRVTKVMAQQYLTPELLAKALEKGLKAPTLTSAGNAAPVPAIALTAASQAGAVMPSSAVLARAVREKNAHDPMQVSQESINARAADAKAGLRTVRVRPDDSVEPLPGLESRDPGTIKGEPVLSISRDGDVTIVNRAGMSPESLQGLINRLRANGKLD